MDAPDAHMVEEALEQPRSQMGEDAFNATARRVARESPELAYGLTQTEWAAAVRKLTTQVHVR